MSQSIPKTCVTPDGFRYAVHQPSYSVVNLRSTTSVQTLGSLSDGTQHHNSANFPESDVAVNSADTIYEIPNPFPFRGTTYITKSWAESKVEDPCKIAIDRRESSSLCQTLEALGHTLGSLEQRVELLEKFPTPVLLAMAANSTDPNDLTALAHISCEFTCDDKHSPEGLLFEESSNGKKAVINNHSLFEIVVNNPSLPDAYKEVMVLRPGVQGGSEIVGEWARGDSHIFEYLRRNSYIPWGHYAANMANDSIRYNALELKAEDMQGLRHLYYQRTYTRLAELLDIALPDKKRLLEDKELESLRLNILGKKGSDDFAALSLSGTLWGWNYGFDCAASKYRLHASHQMIHQQFAMLPSSVPVYLADDTLAAEPWQTYEPYSCGDLIRKCMDEYQQSTGNDFFIDYESAIRNNRRIDGRDNLSSSLIIHEDMNILLFVPKAQTSQWELQLLVKNSGNVLEADTETRQSINSAMLIAIQTLGKLGAEMVSTIEFSKRLQDSSSQRLLYAFLPKLPFSPGAFSEAQLRWINGHYPEDFARACRKTLNFN